MDFSKFLNDDFNVTTWVNDAFKSWQEEEGGTAAQNKRDVYAATLVTKLQVFIQEVNKSLEDMSQQVVMSMPRVLRDVEALKQETAYLRQQMQQVRDEIHDVEQRTSQSMKVLVLTDQVRSKVEKSCAALKEADNWSSLAAAIEDVFRSGDVQEIAVRLKSMQNSLEILKDSPDYDDKVMHLEALKNRLESHVSPRVVTTFMKHNTDEAKKMQVVFSTINRENELHKYYIKCYSTNLITQWQEITSNEDDKSNVSVMKDIFNMLLSTWHSQLPWCQSVFGSAKATDILIRLITQVLATTKPGISDITSIAMETSDEPKVLVLLNLYDTAKVFSSNLLESVQKSKESGFVPGSKLVENLADSLWLPFAQFQMNFKELETEILLMKLSEVVMDAGDIMDLTQVLGTSAEKIFMIATEAVMHCEKLTGYLGLQDVVTPLNTFFHTFTDKFSRSLRTVNIQYGLNTKDGSGVEISEEHYYSLFQHALRIISTCGKLLQMFSDFEQRLISNVLASKTAEEALLGLMELDNRKLAKDTIQESWTNYNYLMKTDQRVYRKFQDLLISLQQAIPSQRSLLSSVKQLFLNLNQQAHQLAFDIAFDQIRKQLVLIPQLEIWNQSSATVADVLVDDSELPTFSLSPTEYATRIGQHLMTLPQHLEPLAAGLNESSGGDLSAMETALHTAKLPYSIEDDTEKSDIDNMADKWLSSIVRATEQTYVEACLQIPELSGHTARQLAADLDYMGNVVDSLGLPVLKDITVVTKLLRTPETEYLKLGKEFPKRFLTTVANIRNIKHS